MFSLLNPYQKKISTRKYYKNNYITKIYIFKDVKMLQITALISSVKIWWTILDAID